MSYQYKKINILFPPFLFLIISCSTYHATKYDISDANVIAMQQRTGGKEIKIHVNEFTAASTVKQDLMCRAAGPVKPSPGKTFQKYIEDALRDELYVAEIYDPNATIKIDGLLQKINFDSGVETSKWEIDLDISSSTGTSYSVSNIYEFSGSYFADNACSDGAETLPAAVNDLIEKIINHPEFGSLIGI